MVPSGHKGQRGRLLLVYFAYTGDILTIGMDHGDMLTYLNKHFALFKPDSIHPRDDY